MTSILILLFLWQLHLIEIIKFICYEKHQVGYFDLLSHVTGTECLDLKR
jgi:hypothetical protein